MASFQSNTGEKGIDPESISLSIIYKCNKTDQVAGDILLQGNQFELSCSDMVQNIETTRTILNQSPTLAFEYIYIIKNRNYLLESDKDVNAISIRVATEKMLKAMSIIIRYLHLKTFDGTNICVEQARYLLRPNSGLDIELCVACHFLGLIDLQERIEKSLKYGITTSNFINLCKQAATNSLFTILQSCYIWLKREGIQAYQSKEQQIAVQNYIGYDISNEELFYNEESVSFDIFKHFIHVDTTFRSLFCSTGYHSAGNIPSLVDVMTDEDLKKINLSKERSGFPKTIRCYIDRISSETMPGKHSYHFYRQDLNKYLMTAIPVPESNFVVFFDIPDINTTDIMQLIYTEHYIGIMKKNDMGTEFITYDNGVNPALFPVDDFDDIQRTELCKITYKSNIAGKRPNCMKVRVPATKKYFENEENILTSPTMLITRSPRWSDELEGWTLEFKGRARKPSKRNFQLIYSYDENEIKPSILMCFGKQSSVRYSCDYASPLSSLQAFSIAMTCFMKKRLAV